MTNRDIVVLGLLFLVAFGVVSLGIYYDPKVRVSPTDVCGGSGSHPVTVGSVMVVGCK